MLNAVWVSKGSVESRMLINLAGVYGKAGKVYDRASFIRVLLTACSSLFRSVEVSCQIIK